MAPTPPESVPFVKTGDPLPEFLPSFWQRQVYAAENETPDYRHPALPFARIKKVMKSDPEVKMIAADAPFLLCKACEIFIAEITARAFIIADSNKRRTLSRADIAKALTKSDLFDFLIDIVPRDDAHLQPYPGVTKDAAVDGRKKKGKAKDAPQPQPQPPAQPQHQAQLLSAPPHRPLTLDTAPDFGNDNLGGFLDDPNSPIERHGR